MSFCATTGKVLCTTIRVGGMVLAAPFRAAGAIGGGAVNMIAKPIIYGSTAGIALYVAMNPEKSLEIAKELIYQIPGAFAAGVEKAPGAFAKVCDVSSQVYNFSLKYLASKVIPAPTLLGDPVGYYFGAAEPTFGAVALGVAKNAGSLAYDGYVAARPHVTSAVETSVGFIGNKLKEAGQYVVAQFVY